MSSNMLLGKVSWVLDLCPEGGGEGELTCIGLGSTALGVEFEMGHYSFHTGVLQVISPSTPSDKSSSPSCCARLRPGLLYQEQTSSGSLGGLDSY